MASGPFFGETADAQSEELRRRAFLAYLAEDVGGPARAIRGFLDLADEQLRAAGLDEHLPDIARVGAAVGGLTGLIDGLIERGFGEGAGDDAESRLRHDLRTPLNAIIGYTEMIAEDVEERGGHEALLSDLAVILAEARALLGRIDEIVDLSRVDRAEEERDEAVHIALGLARAMERGAETAVAETGRILVVDDIATNRDLLVRRLGREGHETLAAASGAEALEVLAREPVDVILLDILMPDMNGIEVLSRLKRHDTWRRIPVVMVSGLTEMDAVARCIEAGADDHIAKPIEPTILRARLQSCLAKKRWEDRERAYLERIEIEKSRADALLHAVLPGQVVARLNDGETVIADRFESVTILFADLVGFTPIAARMPPGALVQRLDAIFREFDALAERHGVEKIKTIGDAYMAAAGLPEPARDHADRVVAFARDMLHALAEEDHAMPFALRVGVHTGPVIAGLLGRRRFVYDLWGETVNVASRLESSGVPGRVQVSEATAEMLGGRWRLSPRGVIELKGVGPAQTFLVDL